MTRFVYTVWFRNPRKEPDDPDFEWPACFLVEGVSFQAALQWGDLLASEYAAEVPEELVSSEAEPAALSSLPGLETLPVVRVGQRATRDEIGW